MIGCYFSLNRTSQRQPKIQFPFCPSSGSNPEGGNAESDAELLRSFLTVSDYTAMWRNQAWEERKHTYASATDSRRGSAVY